MINIFFLFIRNWYITNITVITNGNYFNLSKKTIENFYVEEMN